jgi:hypothetical protein
MLKSITNTMFVSTMSFAWKLIGTGERVSAAAERWGANDQHAGLAEHYVRKAGRNMTVAGELLELTVNALAMRFRYRDGEVSGMVAWPALIA